MDGPRSRSNTSALTWRLQSGEWEGDALTAVNTPSSWATSNAIVAWQRTKPRSPIASTGTADILTGHRHLEDPVYLAEPYVLTESFRRDANANLFPLTACEPIEELPYLPNPGVVPHYLPGRTVHERGDPKHNIPLEAVMARPETDLSGVPEEAQG